MSAHDEFFLYQAASGPIVVEEQFRHVAELSFDNPILPQEDFSYLQVPSSNFVDFIIPADPPTDPAILVATEQRFDNPVFPVEQSPPVEYHFGPIEDIGLRHPETFDLHVIFPEDDNSQPESTFFVELDDQQVFLETQVWENPLTEAAYEYQEHFFYPWEEIQTPPPPALDPADGIPRQEHPVIDQTFTDDCRSGDMAYLTEASLFQQGRVCPVTTVDVWNTALSALGMPELQTTADNTHGARRIRSVWDNFRRKFIQQHPWNGAKKTIQLGRRTDTPVARWKYMYDLPSDYLHALTVNGNQLQDADTLWEIESTPDGLNKVLMSDAASVILEYVFDPTDVCILSPAALDAMAWGLALAVAANFGKKASEVSIIRREAEQRLRDTRSLDSMEGIPRFFGNDDLLDVSNQSRFPFRGEPNV